MKNLNSNQLENAIKKSQKFLIISLVFLLITGILIFLGIRNNEKKLPTPVSMNELITDSKNEEDVYAYVDVNRKPYLFAVYTEDGKEEDAKFYFAMDSNDYLYVLYMSTADFNRLNVDSIKETPIRVTGLTKHIAPDIKELAIETYNEEMEEEYLTNDNFSEYVGLIYLDMKTNPNDSSLYYIGAFISGLIFLIFIITYLSIWLKNRKVFKNFTSGELEKINLEILELGENPYAKMKLYLLKDYIVDVSNGIIILKYSDVLWAYPYEYRYNGLLVNKNIKLVNLNNKVYDISNTKFLDKNKDQIIEEILVKLKEKNEEIVVGYTKENRKIVKEKIKNKK